MAFVLLALAGASVAGPAAASGTFPDAVKAAVPMECKPKCTICHFTDLGGAGTLRPDGFGRNLQDNFGLVPKKPETVAPAIEAARAASSDVDGDGVLDLDELAVGRDPSNSDANAYTCGEQAPDAPLYGCGSGARIAAGRSFDAVAVLAAAATFALGALRARRRVL